ncbi:MAG TPA: electron transport complex subunit RsxC [Bacteroidales bacterium]|jgi:electron transport complex protein RnfC|nr:electron transport complex subunit RsxC [Bacteroidales bacterium]MCZ2417614.1 electron transport complex subunit RsxC [Burkholderiales bacterium]OQC58228.1 MAG: Electron transport complex protein RnfC [Bacteroidetes bacterium ADurb.Bin013]MBP8998836.1 electron transport complex subunit RsxC [Bacteroidales bacterium]MBV6455997.1 Electron transport complex subunit RnfC [Bacteroidales bacterium]
MSKTFSIGGIHPDDCKFSRDCPIEDFPIPKRVYISMNQHLGMPAVPVVKKGDPVRVGQLIAEPAGFVSAPVHASVSGTVSDVTPYPDFLGKKVLTVVIDTDGDQWEEGIDRSPEIRHEITSSPEDVFKRISESGIVGLGGAAFPTHVKLTPPEGMKPEYLILNGAECEPYLTADYRLMLEHGQEILLGGELMRRTLGAGVNGIIGIEANKPRAIELMRELTSKSLQWKVVPLKKRYPQGGEKQLIDAVLGRRVASFALPVSTGAIVQNVSTAYAVYEAVQKNKPLISKVLTVSSSDSSIQKNYRFRVGTPIMDILSHAGAMEKDGGLSPQFAKVVNGGPMMGKPVSNLEGPVMKSTSGLLLFTEKETKRKEPGECIRCAKCFEACPMRLQPYLLYQLALAGRTEELEEHRVFDCIECGCCLYTCPAHLPLLDQIRLARNASLKNKRKK